MYIRGRLVFKRQSLKRTFHLYTYLRWKNQFQSFNEYFTSYKHLPICIYDLVSINSIICMYNFVLSCKISIKNEKRSNNTRKMSMDTDVLTVSYHKTSKSNREIAKILKLSRKLINRNAIFFESGIQQKAE